MSTAISLESRHNLVSVAPAPASAPFGFAVTGAPQRVLRLEGAAVFAASLVGYAALGGSWGLFAALFLLPDLSMLGYLVDTRVGAGAYNAGHSLLGPALLALVGAVVSASAVLLPIAVIWVAHIGFDRMLGYGLKYGTAFGDTHLGRVGRPGPAARTDA